MIMYYVTSDGSFLSEVADFHCLNVESLISITNEKYRCVIMRKFIFVLIVTTIYTLDLRLSFIVFTAKSLYDFTPFSLTLSIMNVQILR